MIELALYDRDTLLSSFGCSRRLATRLGALRARRIAISATLLEEARPGSSMEALLLAPSLLKAEPTCEEIQRVLSSEIESREAEEELPPLAVIEQEGWIAIVLEEETLAEEAFQEEEKEMSAPPSPPPFPPSVLSLSLSPLRGGKKVLRTPPPPLAIEGEEVSPFSPQEAARLRVTIFAGAESAQKVSALRQFAFAPVPEEEKIAVFLQALADEDAALRAAAPQGLRSFGLEPDLADAAHLLAEEEISEKHIAIERIQDTAGRASLLGRNAALMALIGALRDDQHRGETIERILRAFTTLAPVFDPSALCRDETLRILVERMLASPPKLIPPFRETLRALDQVQPGWVVTYLIKDLLASNSIVYRGALFEILGGFSLSPEERLQLVPSAIETLLQLPTDRDVARVLAAFLGRAGGDSLRRLAAVLPESDVAHQRFLLRFFDTILRTSEVKAEDKTAVAQAALSILRHGPLQARLDVLETHVAARPDLPEPLRKEIAEAFLLHVHDYAQRLQFDALEHALARLGLPAVYPILEALEERRPLEDAAPLIYALGRIGIALSTSAREAEAILRELQKLSFREPSYREAIHRAMGTICGGGKISEEVTRLILRSLLGRMKGGAEDAATLEALGLACASPHADPALVEEVAKRALTHLEATHPDPSLRIGEKEGEEIFVFGEEVDVYSDLLPAAIAAVESIMLGKATPSSLRQMLLERLLARWEKVVRFEIVWGPGNVAHLTEVLGKIGASPLIDDPTRLRIAQILAKRIQEMPVLEALIDILSQGGELPELDRMAGGVILRLLKILEENRDFSAEDEETYLHLLGRIARRGRFSIRGGKEEKVLARVIEALLAGFRKGVPRVLERLIELRDRAVLPPHLQEHLVEELRRLTSLVKV